MTLKEIQNSLYKKMDASSSALNAYTADKRTVMGLVDNSTKSTPEYKQLKSAYTRDFQAVRAFNSQFAKLLHVK
jgi:hypothetical protein